MNECNDDKVLGGNEMVGTPRSTAYGFEIETETAIDIAVN
jgi:hypothetical protein